jgi:hypothetical protein
MKIETAKNILKKHNCTVPQSSFEARQILDQYDRGEMDFCAKDIDQKIEREIYNALTVILCSDMDREHRADCKRAQRQAAKEKARKRNNGWKS